MRPLYSDRTIPVVDGDLLRDVVSLLDDGATDVASGDVGTGALFLPRDAPRPPQSVPTSPSTTPPPPRSFGAVGKGGGGTLSPQPTPTALTLPPCITAHDAMALWEAHADVTRAEIAGSPSLDAANVALILSRAKFAAIPPPRELARIVNAVAGGVPTAPPMTFEVLMAVAEHCVQWAQRAREKVDDDGGTLAQLRQVEDLRRGGGLPAESLTRVAKDAGLLCPVECISDFVGDAADVSLATFRMCTGADVGAVRLYRQLGGDEALRSEIRVEALLERGPAWGIDRRALVKAMASIASPPPVTLSFASLVGVLALCAPEIIMQKRLQRNAETTQDRDEWPFGVVSISASLLGSTLVQCDEILDARVSESETSSSLGRPPWANATMGRTAVTPPPPECDGTHPPSARSDFRTRLQQVYTEGRRQINKHHENIEEALRERTQKSTQKRFVRCFNVTIDVTQHEAAVLRQSQDAHRSHLGPPPPYIPTPRLVELTPAAKRHRDQVRCRRAAAADPTPPTRPTSAKRRDTTAHGGTAAPTGVPSTARADPTAPTAAPSPRIAAPPTAEAPRPTRPQSARVRTAPARPPRPLSARPRGAAAEAVDMTPLPAPRPAALHRSRGSASSPSERNHPAMDDAAMERLVCAVKARMAARKGGEEVAHQRLRTAAAAAAVEVRPPPAMESRGGRNRGGYRLEKERRSRKSVDLAIMRVRQLPLSLDLD